MATGKGKFLDPLPQRNFVTLPVSATSWINSCVCNQLVLFIIIYTSMGEHSVKKTICPSSSKFKSISTVVNDEFRLKITC